MATNSRLKFSVIGLVALLVCATQSPGTGPNLIQNSDFKNRSAFNQKPAGFDCTGDVEFRPLGDPPRDTAGWGVALESSRQKGSVSQTITGLDANIGRWFRFTFRGLPQENFAVANSDLYMKVEYFSDSGRTALDGKAKKIYPLVEQDRRDLNVNGDHRVGGAAVWRTYQLDFWLPFPQVDQLRLSVGFDHGAAHTSTASEFFVADFCLVRIDGPAMAATTQPSSITQPRDNLLPIGGRWFYRAKSGEAALPDRIDSANADRLLYHDDQWQTPFAGEMSAWLRAGDKDIDGNIVTQDRLVADNVTINFDTTSLIIHTKGLPNHATGKFPESGRGRGFNPNYIQEQRNVYYIPLNPQVNARHVATATDNSNHALPMGPIGLAINGVVFFNPFDAGNMDASNIMDYCCGHPNQDNFYHYHKYPICMYSPWRDEGTGHSPVIGWAFDGFAVYGPYESAGVMAKDVKGPHALNEFNLHWDKDRGWHYHVTPGRFPYIIGGYWGTEDSRDAQRPHHPAGALGPPEGPSR